MCAMTCKWLKTLSQPHPLLQITDEERRPKTRRESPTDTEPVVTKPRLFHQRVVLWMKRKWLRNGNGKCWETGFNVQKYHFHRALQGLPDSQARPPIISTRWGCEAPTFQNHPPATPN